MRHLMKMLLEASSAIVAVQLLTVHSSESVNLKSSFSFRVEIHDRDADTRPCITDTCTASMALKASSSIFIKCHILPKLTLLTTWIVDDLPRQRNLKKLGIKRT